MASALHPAQPLPKWVLELRGDRCSAVAVAVDVADATLALGDVDASPNTRHFLTAIVERAGQTGQGVPVSVAARTLAVTEPTVRSWIGRGALDAVPESRPLLVTVRSLGEALAASVSLRRLGHDERLLHRLLDLLEDQRTRIELADRIAELDDRVPLDVDRIAEELFSERSSRTA